ncbi:preprotein translocase [Candidatus Saccharibacteria bacterium]|nr:MAG: preprotein translocase [Candidatus Saccharibacteria bacterium]
MIEFFDTHCHIHEITAPESGLHKKWHSDGVARTAESVLQAARAAGVSRLIVVGTTLEDSELAVQFAQAHENVWAAVGMHPHEAKKYTTTQKTISGGLSSQDDCGGGAARVLPEAAARFRELVVEPKVVAVGECGLDYYYRHASQAEQDALLRFQIHVACERDLPLSFHVRSSDATEQGWDAFGDFWKIYDSYQNVRGVLHSFTDTQANVERALARGLYIGVNGIATFTKDEEQLVTYRTIPQQSLLLETDAPFLTPQPFRGKICEPKHVVRTAEYLADLRDETLDQLACATTTNAAELFNVK